MPFVIKSDLQVYIGYPRYYVVNTWLHVLNEFAAAELLDATLNLEKLDAARALSYFSNTEQPSNHTGAMITT